MRHIEAERYHLARSKSSSSQVTCRPTDVFLVNQSSSDDVLVHVHLNDTFSAPLQRSDKVRRRIQTLRT